MIRPVNLLERLRRWWAPGEYDDEPGRPPSDGEGFALTDEEYAEKEAADPIVAEHEPHP